jgi:hypothetical protein
MAARPEPSMFAVTMFRLLLAGNDALLWTSALIVCAVQGSLIAGFPDSAGAHNVYALTIVRAPFSP